MDKPYRIFVRSFQEGGAEQIDSESDSNHSFIYLLPGTLNYGDSFVVWNEGCNHLVWGVVGVAYNYDKKETHIIVDTGLKRAEVIFRNFYMDTEHDLPHPCSYIEIAFAVGLDEYWDEFQYITISRGGKQVFRFEVFGMWCNGKFTCPGEELHPYWRRLES